MTTLVTGAGLIGSEFARCAMARGERVVFVDPEPRDDFLRMKLGTGGAWTLARHDVRDLPALIDIAKTHRVETLVHTAGLIGPRVQDSLSLAFDINLGGTRNVAETTRLAGVRRLVHISSLAVYDRRRETAAAIAEDFPRGGTRGYGNYKTAKELMLEAYAALHGFELIMLRPANVFGLGHYWAGSSGGRKMQNLIEAAFAGETARISAADAAPFEYVYAKDTGRAVDLAATVRLPAERVFNISNGYVTPLAEVIAAVKTLLPALHCEIEAGAAPSASPAPLDIARAKRHLGWEPRFSIAEAFADYLAELKQAKAAA